MSTVLCETHDFFLTCNAVHVWFDTILRNSDTSVLEKLASWFESSLSPPSPSTPPLNPPPPLSACWRTPFYLHGKYTKLRRDCPQTPFLVREKGVNIRKGIGSVEDAITAGVTKAIGSIMSCNDFHFDNKITTTTTTTDLPKPGIFYGKCKFHGSGREDMDVRMLNLEGKGGRPFCCEIIDGQCVPDAPGLLLAKNSINNR